MSDQPSPNDSAPSTDARPERPPEYCPIDWLRVGPSLVELADRLSFGRDAHGTPRAAKRRTITLILDRELESRAEALALARVLEHFAGLIE